MPKERTSSRTAAAAAARRLDMTGITAIQSRIHCPNEDLDWWQKLDPRQRGEIISSTAARAADPNMIVVRLPANVATEVGKWWAGLTPTQRGEMVDRMFKTTSNEGEDH